ncbi:membrane protein [Formivibrio citricus]|uniref:UPF0761 membrane protein SAMN05660284_02407 n=1 Tax=Formivibrio citricus TaxID=83765 RepID=A0A1I5CGW7_9NEIS|nr:YihY family inner membrane protein [Formivibrio citricus]SFN85881.1 membrane protein [Formivibrio citricus]
MPFRLPSIQSCRRTAGFGRFVWGRLIADRCLQTAGSLTYTSLLAIVPLFTIALTLFSAFPMFGNYSVKFRSFVIANLVPDASGKVIGIYMRQFSENAENLTAMGMVGLAATAFLMMFTIEKTLNQIWGVPRTRNPLARTMMYWAALTLGPLLIGLSFSLTSMLPRGFAAQLSGMGVPLLNMGPWLLVFLMLFMLFVAVPNCYVPRNHALIAALVTATLLSLMKSLFGLYIKNFGTFKLVYGTFSSLPIFLIWLYVSWVIVLAGAVLSACLSYWHNDAWRWPRGHNTRFEQAMLLLLALSRAHHDGEVLHINTLRRRAGIGIDVANQLLECMAQKKWVEASRDGNWLLAVDLGQIRLIEVFEQVVTPLQTGKEQALAPLMLQMREPLELTMAEYARQVSLLRSPERGEPPTAEPASPESA